MQAEEDNRKAVKSALHRLQPLARRIFSADRHVLHELKYINTQPAFLTNYQQYYCGLRQGLHTEALAAKLRRTLTELDILLAGEEQRAAEVEQQAKKAEKERDEQGKKWLAVLVEAIALPYYFYNLMKYALYDFLHLKNGLLTWGITIPVTAVIIYGTLRAMRSKKRRKKTKKKAPAG